MDTDTDTNPIWEFFFKTAVTVADTSHFETSDIIGMDIHPILARAIKAGNLPSTRSLDWPVDVIFDAISKMGGRAKIQIEPNENTTNFFYPQWEYFA